MAVWERVISALQALFGAQPNERNQSPATNIFISSSGNTINLNQSSNRFEVNIDKALNEKPEEISKIIHDAVLVEDIPLFDEKCRDRIQDVKQTPLLDNERRLLQFLKDKIPQQDISVLRASVYVKKRFDQRAPDAQELKLQIRQRFGLRSKNIFNVYSAGYFEKLIIPLYEELSKQQGFNNEKFLEIYNIIIDQAAFSEFVHAWMTDGEVQGKIKNRIHQNIGLGLRYINIHGIGKDNIKKIRNAVSELEADPAYNFSKKEETTGQAIFVRLEFLEPLPCPPSEIRT